MNRVARSIQGDLFCAIRTADHLIIRSRHFRPRHRLGLRGKHQDKRQQKGQDHAHAMPLPQRHGHYKKDPAAIWPGVFTR